MGRERGVTHEHLYALIMAGGSGTRLWPRSRSSQPKQFLDLLADQTMLQEAQARLLPLVPPDRTLVGTGRDFIDLVRQQLPEVPPANILGEPEGRDTAAAIGLAAVSLRSRDPDAIMAVVTADHRIARPDVLRGALAAGAELAAQGWLVTLGIQPTGPETGYGYVERGERLGAVADYAAFQVARFVEKPSRERAEQYVRAGTYAWNSGMFIWKVEAILAELSKHLPDLYAGLQLIERDLGTPRAQATFDRVWPELPRKSIDFAVMEKTRQAAVIPVDLGWSDVGSWNSVYDVLPQDANANALVGEHVISDSVRCLVYAPNRLVAMVGVADLIVVDTGDARLICPRERAQDVKQLVALLRERGNLDLL
jgi:mannose-1-phosphate guanylyltransferase